MTPQKDVAIIGAGPSGSVAAALLVQQGFSVVVLERQRFPRFSIGESLLAQSLELVEQAGLLEPVLAGGFQFKNGAAFTRGPEYSEFNFAQKSCAGPGFTFQVPRGEFDKILIDAAEKMGAEVRYEVEITAADFSNGPRLVARDASGRVEELRPKLVLDASGFGRTLPRLLGLESPSRLPTRSALYTQIHDRIPSGAFDRQKIRIVIHPEHHEVWFWLIPFSNGKASFGVVADDAFLQAMSGTHEEKLFTLGRQDPGLLRLLADATPAIPVGELRGYSANVSTMCGPGFALLGNAAEFLDPVFSSGVTIAMKSSHLAVAAAVRELRGEQVDWKADFEAPLRVGVETFRGFVETWYTGELQDIIFYDERKQSERIRRYICSILAGYAWDKDNPYVGEAKQKLVRLAQVCRGGVGAA
ncbi:MAG: tryptophan 7-halogenase [Myxococcales bacterium]|nr:tryptophan 7-halogenase [Myxococcales bacterium]